MKIVNGILTNDDGKTQFHCPFEPSIMLPPKIAGMQPGFMKVLPCRTTACTLGFELVKGKNKEGAEIDIARFHCVRREFPVTIVKPMAKNNLKIVN